MLFVFTSLKYHLVLSHEACAQVYSEEIGAH